MSLTKHIVKHILSNLGIDNDVMQPLKTKEYLLKEKLVFDTSDGIHNDIWGCQFIMEQKKLTILLSEIIDPDIDPEYYVLIHLEGSPNYGMYYSTLPEEYDEQSKIACSVNGKDWFICNMYLQATFLAGMEQIKDIGHIQQRCVSYQEEYQSLLSFLKFDEMLSEEEDYEGQEN